jgi:predicted naringenin-chalcone synthase
MQRIARLPGIERRYLAALKYQSRTDEHAVYRPASVQPTGPGMAARTELFEREAGPLVLRALGAFPREVLSSIDALVTVSCTHASSPGLERPILTQTPVRPSVDRWNLGFMGCSAGLAGIRLAHQTAGRRHNCLVVACELSSLHFQYTDQLDQMTANVLFSDGAAAVLLSPEPSGARVVDCRCVAAPAHADQMVWFAGDSGLRLRLSQELPNSLAAHLPAAVDGFLRDNGLQRSQVDHWLVHPGGPQILEAVEKSLKLPERALDLSWGVLREFGNMSSPTVFFILKRLLATRATGTLVAMAFGPGLTIELVLLSLGQRHP